MRTTRARARLPAQHDHPFAWLPLQRLAWQASQQRSGPPAHRRPSEPTPEQYGAARSLVGAFRTHGHLAARLDPLGTDPPGDPALEPSYHGLDQAILERVPAALLSVAVPGESAGRGPAAPARDLLRPGRVPDRAPLARTSSAAGCARRSSAAASRSRRRCEEQQQLLIRLAARRGVRAYLQAHVPRREAVLDRGRRHDDPDARRGDRDLRRAGHRARPSSAWRTAAG